MYGGLFGDLPAAKNDTTKGNDEGETKATTRILSAGEKSSASTKSHAPEPPPPPGSLGLGLEGATKSTGGSTLTMLPRFIPTQATRPRQRQRGRTIPISSESTRPIAAEGTAAVSHVREAISPAIETTTTTTASSNQGASDDGGRAKQGLQASSTAADVVVEDQERHEYPSHQEPERLRLLHERAAEDPYDPLVPNDLLLYWERKSLATEREQLVRLQKEKIREQEQLRVQLQEERRILDQQGDVDKIVEHRMLQSMGRGRGGVSNVPAWLVEKQKKQQQQQQPNPT